MPGAGAASDMNPYLRLIHFAILPIAKVMVMCSLGLLLAQPYLNVLTAQNRKILSKLVFAIFLPCIIFTQLGSAIDAKKMLSWWFIPANIMIASTLGSLLGYALALIIRPPPQFFNLTVVMVGIGNIGNVPLVLLSSICSDRSSPFGDPAKCYQDGVAYISFGQWAVEELWRLVGRADCETPSHMPTSIFSCMQVGAIVVYTWAYNMLAPPPGHVDSHADLTQLSEPLPHHRHHLSWEETEDSDYVPLMQAHEVPQGWTPIPEHALVPHEGSSSKPAGGAAEDEAPERETPVVHVAPWRTGAGRGVEELEASYTHAWRSLGDLAEALRLKEILQPPVVSSILALVVGCLPSVKTVFFNEDAPLLWVIDGLNIMGGAMIPCIMLALGGNLVGGPGSSTLGTRTTVAITATRLLLSPLIGLATVYIADHLGWLPPHNPMFRFVLLLQHSMPSSILVGALATMRGYAEKEAAAILFWEHICAVISMACWLMLYLKILFPH